MTERRHRTQAPTRVHRYPLPAILALLIGGILTPPALPADDGLLAGLAEPLAAILAVGPEGAGNTAAAAGWQRLAAADAGSLPAILAAMDGANALAKNYLRSAAEVVAERRAATGGALPVAGLGEFLLDPRHDPQARELAFELLASSQPELAEQLVPGLLNDPSVTLRRKAVARLIDGAGALAKAENAAAAGVIYRQALAAARDVDQIQEVTKALRGLGRAVDLPRHFGFLMHWKVTGPFDNTGRDGFGAVFPPEEKIDLSATYTGKGGAEVPWTDFVTADDYGMVDINQAYGPLKEVTAYAFTTFEAAEARPVELRLGSKNAWKVWLNGELLFGRDEYHRGMRIDQYRLRGQLNAGRNTILVKLCQNEQTEDWTVQWQFQLRVCDATGTAVLAADRPPTPTEGTGSSSRRGRKKNS